MQETPSGTFERYEIGRAGDLEDARPTVLELQRAQRDALQRGDRRRVAAYQAVIFRRLAEAQSAVTVSLAA